MDENKYWTQEQIEEYLSNLKEYDEKDELNIDMHNHTTGSDGNDSPLMLLLRAHRMGLKTISITDHNSVSGYQQLIDQAEKTIRTLEEIDQREDISEEEKEKVKIGAKRILKVLEEMQIVPGCEVLTIFKGCPYVEILAYGVDPEVLEQKLKEIRTGLDSPGEVLYHGLKEAIKKHGIKIDEFFMENRSDYRKLFFHELIRHPENAYLYEGIEGETEEEKAENFAKKYIDNPESDFYVDLNNPKTRKAEMQSMIKRHKDLVFDVDIIKHAGSAAGQFYTELIKYPENQELIDKRIDCIKRFNYLGLYNENSPFFVDLSSTKPSLESVIRAIHEAGGKALVAHWGRYIQSNEEVFNWQTEEGRGNLEEIIDVCDGAECAYPDNPMELQRLIYNLCRQKGKIVSIGGDNHGKSGKEGMQYQLGSQHGREVEGLEWVKESVVEGKEFLQMCEERYAFRDRLRKLLGEKRDKEEALRGMQSREEEDKTKDEGNVLGE